MPGNFSRTLRALRSDGLFGWAVRSLIAALLLALWGAWFFWGRITVYAVSDSARAEVDQQVYPVQAPVDGRVVSTRIELDLEVEAGEVLLELEAREQELRLAEERARSEGLSAQLEKLRNELSGEERALTEWLKAKEAEIGEARARYEEAATGARLAEEEEQRVVSLHEKGLVSELDLLRARSEREQKQALAESLRTAPSRLAFDRSSEESNRRAKLDSLRRAEADLASRLTAAASSEARLEQDLGLRRIRAPISGRLGQVVPLRAGGFVEEGDRLAVVVPQGRIKAVAEFEPAAAVGRVRSGQPARLRLLGFPSTQYGSIPATVSRVASEASGGSIRVELEVRGEADSPIPLQHGMPGTVEVEVERASPAALVLRAVGRLLDRPSARRAAAGGAG